MMQLCSMLTVSSASQVFTFEGPVVAEKTPQVQKHFTQDQEDNFEDKEELSDEEMDMKKDSVWEESFTTQTSNNEAAPDENTVRLVGRETHSDQSLLLNTASRIKPDIEDRTPTEDICQLDSDPGPCRMSMQRFFWNAKSSQCEEFIYGGCQGNENNFATKEECENRCEKTVCPSGYELEKVQEAQSSKGIKIKTLRRTRSRRNKTDLMTECENECNKYQECEAVEYHPDYCHLWKASTTQPPIFCTTKKLVKCGGHSAHSCEFCPWQTVQNRRAGSIPIPTWRGRQLCKGDCEWIASGENSSPEDGRCAPRHDNQSDGNSNAKSEEIPLWTNERPPPENLDKEYHDLHLDFASERQYRLTNNVPEVHFEGNWVPICGHYFWDNDHGAGLFCQKIGRGSKGTVSGRNLGQRYDKKSYWVGKCNENDNDLDSCTGACNERKEGGECNTEGFGGECNKEDNVKITIKCSEIA